MPNSDFTKVTQNIIQQVDKLKSELNQYRPLDKEQEARISQQFRLWWNYHSNSIEGNSLTYGETRMLILHGLTAQGKPLRHHFEVVGHNEALKWLMDIVKKEYPLTEQFIRALHQLILKDRYQKKVKTPEGIEATAWVEVGKYKEKPNHVEKSTGEIFRYATPEETPAKMEDLIAWYREREEKNDLHPLLLAVEIHYRFILIHPFDDGNGRIARLLLNFILLRHDYPPIIIRKEDKESYLLALEQADAGELNQFINFIGENLIVSLRLMIRGAQGEDISEFDDWEKRIELLQLSLEKEAPPTVEQTDELIWQRYQDSFLPLFKQLVSKLKRFDKLYAKNKHVPTYSFRESMSAKPQDQSIEDFIKFKYEAGSISNFQELGYRFQWEALKNSGTHLPSMSISIYIELDHRFKYIIKTSYRDIQLEKLYSEKVSIKERNTFVSKIGNQLTNMLEQQIKAAKK